MGSLPAGDVVRTPIIEHLRELRRRLLMCLLFVAVGAGIGYYMHESLLAFIQAPLGQKLFYTSPTGGFSFVFMICVFFGVVLALPFIIYHLIAFLRPVLPRMSRRSAFAYPLCSVGLAALGIAFAYHISLPASLHFLANFGGGNIEALITTDTYFNFAISYIAGFAILFQLPLILIITNRITPLKPGKLMKWQRYVIIGSFIGAAIITPTPDPFNQLLMAGPIILLYQVSVLLIWIINRIKKQPREVPVAATSSRVPHVSSPPLIAGPSLVPPLTVIPQSTAPKRRLISDIGASHRNFRQPSKQPTAAAAPRQPKAKAAPPRPNGPPIPTKWNGGLIDVMR